MPSLSSFWICPTSWRWTFYLYWFVISSFRTWAWGSVGLSWTSPFLHFPPHLGSSFSSLYPISAAPVSYLWMTTVFRYSAPSFVDFQSGFAHVDHSVSMLIFHWSYREIFYARATFWVDGFPSLPKVIWVCSHVIPEASTEQNQSPTHSNFSSCWQNHRNFQFETTLNS